MKTLAASIALLLTRIVVASGAESNASVFENQIRAILADRCTNCHSTEKQKGDLDLERFTSLDLVKREPAVWEHTLEQLGNGEMPPKGKPQLSPEQKATLTKWVESTLDEIALASAGDPGPIALRRLREDDQLQRLMLDDAQRRELDALWAELRFVSESPLKQVDAFEQLWQFATQDAKPEAFEPMREPIRRAAEDFRKWRIETEPRHVQAVLDFAARAWRRPLSDAEQNELRALYQKLRAQELPHAEAVRMLVARVLVAPAFLYRGEKPAPGPKATPVGDWEIATRLSYFLWSSQPDDELRALAAAGKLRDPATLAAQAQRMLGDVRVRRLATEFGCQWLHVRDVATLDEKSERHFPTFASLRAPMQEEVAQFFIDLFQHDRSVLSLLDADHTFVNAALAQHYGWEVKGSDWQRVEGVRARDRGGILGFAATLARQSGASRTSPILRGNWLSEVVLGERLPRPPKGVPVLPEESPQGLTERQLIERHSSDAKCAGCHQRIDPFGFALEGFDAIGRARSIDAAGLPIDTSTRLPNGTEIADMPALRAYLVTQRSDDFLRQFSRKLLGFALGRSVQLSDKPLIESMIAQLKANGYRAGVAIDRIVRSPQFREVRGRDFLTQN